jgi:hypothetical protein
MSRSEHPRTAQARGTRYRSAPTGGPGDRRTAAAWYLDGPDEHLTPSIEGDRYSFAWPRGCSADIAARLEAEQNSEVRAALSHMAGDEPHRVYQVLKTYG